MDDIFKKYDKRLKLNPKGYVRHAKKRGFGTYAEYVYVTLKTNTARSISEDMRDSGVENYPKVMTLTNMKYKLSEEVEKNNGGKICVKCKKRVIPANLHSHCQSCYSQNVGLASSNDVESFSVNYVGSH